METSYKNLSLSDKNLIVALYEDSYAGNSSMAEVQEVLSKKFGVTTRSIRNWAKSLGLNLNAESIEDPFKVLVYDIETSRVPAMVFSTGKTYINHTQLKDEFKIISICYKWLGHDKVYSLEWDTNHSDEELVRKFLQVYNQADMVVGYNNDKYDNKWIHTRAAKFKLKVNLHVKSFDLYKQIKRLMYLPSYSMAYASKYFGVIQKQSHEGIKMWDMVQSGTKEQQKEFMAKMIMYNIGDIITTEELYIRLRSYMGHKVHLGVFLNDEKYSCPNCGGTNIEEFNGNFSVTAMGTIQRHMICKDDEVQFKMANTIFLKNQEE